MEKQEFKFPKLKQDDKVVAQVFERIMQDENAAGFIQKYELNQDFIMENLAIFLRYVEENEPCKNCPGIKACIKEPKGYDTILEFGERDLEIVYRKCEKNRAQNRIMVDYHFHDFDDAWLEKRLDAVALNPERHFLFLNLANILKAQGQHDFYIYSDRAVGKSYISAMICNEVVFGLEKPAAFVNAKLLMDRLRSTIFDKKQEYDDILTKLEQAYLVVIDDLGSEKVTDLSVEILTGIIDYRMKNGLATIITSNYNTKELEGIYRAFQLKAKRMLARILNGFEIIYLDGIDYRKIK